MGAPVCRDMDRANIGYLAAGFMRCADNSMFGHEIMLAVAEMAREARDGAGYSRAKVQKAVRGFSKHPRFRKVFNEYGGIFWAAYDGLREKCESRSVIWKADLEG